MKLEGGILEYNQQLIEKHVLICYNHYLQEVRVSVHYWLHKQCSGRFVSVSLQPGTHQLYQSVQHLHQQVHDLLSFI